jgi:hypothetical protein
MQSPRSSSRAGHPRPIRGSERIIDECNAPILVVDAHGELAAPYVAHALRLDLLRIEGVLEADLLQPCYQAFHPVELGPLH